MLDLLEIVIIKYLMKIKFRYFINLCEYELNFCFTISFNNNNNKYFAMITLIGDENFLNKMHYYSLNYFLALIL